MDKKHKRGVPKLRKEDIGIPVNFVHVKHVGLNRNPESPETYQTQDCPSSGFPNSDTTSTISHREKENRNSDSSVDAYNTTDNNDEFNYRQKKFSGSLLNLSFLPFSKEKRDSKSKRTSLGATNFLALTSFTHGKDSSAPENSSTASKELQSRPSLRRRSSSFNGEYDNEKYLNLQERSPPSLDPSGKDKSVNGSWGKKAKIQKQVSLPGSHSPPLSPSYDDLPPPPMLSPNSDNFPATPADDDLPPPASPPLPSSPNFDELPPPPEDLGHTFSDKNQPVDAKQSNSEESDGHLPLPPPSFTEQESKNTEMIASHQTQKSAKIFENQDNVYEEVNIENLGLNDNFNNFPPPLPATDPPPELPHRGSNNQTKYSHLKGKLKKVNVPKLPSLEIAGTSSGDSQNSSQVVDKTQDFNPKTTKKSISVEEIQALPEFQKSSGKSGDKMIDENHVSPIGKLLQCRIPCQEYPEFMKELFSKTQIKTTPQIETLYGEIIQKTMLLWLETQQGSAPLENIVAAFEDYQDNKDTVHTTKL